MEPVCVFRHLRLRYNITLVEIAKAANVAPQNISKIELETVRHTPYHNELLRKALFAMIAERRSQLSSLEEELKHCDWLFSPVREESTHGQ